MPSAFKSTPCFHLCAEWNCSCNKTANFSIIRNNFTKPNYPRPRSHNTEWEQHEVEDLNRWRVYVRGVNVNTVRMRENIWINIDMMMLIRVACECMESVCIISTIWVNKILLFSSFYTRQWLVSVGVKIIIEMHIRCFQLIHFIVAQLQHILIVAINIVVIEWCGNWSTCRRFYTF